MVRRGPDHVASHTHRTERGRSVQLLHSRLSIIDLDERANQPFDTPGGVLAFNGELYDYREHATQLGRYGIRLQTRSDTEVFARLLGSGEPGSAGVAATLDQCEGMWAVAWLDVRDGRLHLARDRFGEKPLYLLEGDAGWYFASEEKMLAALSGRRLKPDLAQVRRFLINGYKAVYKQPGTFFEGVTELPPGTLLTFEPDGARRQLTYWQAEFVPDDTMTFDDATKSVRAALTRAVELRLRADAPLAFCMSGGIDSNSLLCIAKRELGADVHGFTIVNTDGRYEEMALVRHVVDEVGIDHTAVALSTAGFLDNLQEIVHYHDAPVLNLSYYVHWLLEQSIAEKGFRVSVSGTGADELFSGYYDHHLWYLLAVRADEERWRRARADWLEHVRPIVRNPFLQDPDRFVDDPSFRDHIFLRADEFATWLHDAQAEPFAEHAYTDDPLRNRMLNELFHEAVPVILHEDDRNAMYHSVENRSPFLDRGLTEASLRIPTRHLVRNGYAKAVLREAMRGIVPDRVLNERRKVGFNAPIGDLLDAADSATRQRLLGNSPIYDVVRRDAIEPLLNGAVLPNSESKFLFYFASAKAFLEEHAP